MAAVCVAMELNLNPHPLHTTETQRIHPAGNKSKPAAFKPKAAAPAPPKAAAGRRLITLPNEYYGRSSQPFLACNGELASAGAVSSWKKESFGFHVYF